MSRATRLLSRLPGTLSLCAVTVGLFVAQLAIGGSSDLTAIVRLGALAPARLAEHHEVFRLFMPALLHANALHLLVVVLGLLQVGALVESVWGARRLLVVWVWSAVGGALTSTLFADLPNIASVGGSAGVLGLAGLLLGTMWFGSDPARGYLAEAIGRRVMRVVFVGFLMGLGAWMGWPIADNWAHLGALICGIALSATLPEDPAEQPWLGPVTGATAAFVLAMAALTAISGDDALPTLELDAARTNAAWLSHERGGWLDADLAVDMIGRYERAGALDEGLEVVERLVHHTDELAGLARLAVLLTQGAESGRPWDRHAQVVVERWLELDPASADALNLAAWRLVTRNDHEARDPWRAERLSRDAIARIQAMPEKDRPTAQASFLDTLAEALFQQGRFAEAAEAQRQAVEVGVGLELETLPIMRERLARIEQALAG